MKESNLTNLVIVLQQHPGAKAKNIDRSIVEDWIGKHGQLPQAPRIIISDSNSDDAQTVADGALYYQTSMGPQFVLAGIPTIQIAHETYEDVLVRNRLSPSVTRIDHFIRVIDSLTQQKKEVPQGIILEGLGIKKDWLQTLETAIKKATIVAVPRNREVSLSGFTGKKSYWPYLAAGGAILAGLLVVRFLKPRRS
jgi:hypothetical protein